MASEEKVVTLDQLGIVKGYIDNKTNLNVPTKTSELVNDSKFQTDTDVDATVFAHNADKTAHSFILGEINGVADRVRALEIANGAEVTANPFAVTFGSLDGTVSDGIWDAENAQLGF